MSPFRPARIAWLVAYLAFAVALVFAMLHLRRQVIATYETPVQQDYWEEWRDAAGSEPAGGVARSAPSSSEPPSLVLMRDYFPMCLAASLVFGSALFFVTTLLVGGVFRRPAGEQKIRTKG